MLIAVLTSALCGNFAHAQVVSDFSADADGWLVGDQGGNSPVTISHNPTGGNPDGYVSAVVPADGNHRFWFAPAKFMGNRAYTSYGETLTFDVRTSTPAPEHSTVGDIMLSNGSQSIYLNVTPLPSQSPTWTHYSIKLDETANWKQSSIAGPTANRELVIAVLTNLSTIRIFMQWKFAVNITGGLDNVVLNVHPAAPPTPVISSLSATKAPQGSSLTINGSAFGTTPAENAVYFGSVKGAIESASATTIVVKVPTSADYGPVKVVNLSTGLGGMSQHYFTPMFASGGGATLTAGSFDNFTRYNRTLGYMTHGDINGDGKPEMVMANGNLISIFENVSTTGTIDANSFGPRIDLQPSAPDGYTEIKMDDLDNDGKLDIFVAIRDAPDQGRIVVLPNIHTAGPITAGSFGPFIDVTFPPYTLSAAHSADLDGDGRPELLGWGSSCGANPVYILQNISTPGNIRFTSQFSLNGIYTCAGKYQAADLDGDGKTDIIQSGDNNTRIFRNTSVPGTLSFEAPFDLGDGTNHTTIGDLDNDNKPDIAFASGGLKVYKNISTAGSLSGSSFTGVTVFVGGISMAKIADFNGDGKPDVVTSINGGLAVYQNVTPDGQINPGTFRPYVVVDGGGSAASAIDVADFDNDGKPDIVSNNGGFSNVAVVRNRATAPPTITAITPVSAPPGSTITISGTAFSTTAANNHVWFGQAKATVSNATETSLEVVVPVGASHDQVSVALNGYTIYSKEYFVPTFSGGADFNASSFAAAVERAVGGVNALEVCDFDVDGKVDILCDNNGSTAILRNIGTTGVIDGNTFAANSPTGVFGYPLRKGDFDGDGKLDLTIHTYVSRNVSSPALPNPVAFDTYLTRDQTNPTPSDFSNFRDMNNDGKIDIAFAGAIANIYVQGNATKPGGFYDYGSLNQSFTTNSSFTKPAAGGSAVVADFDGDGFNDLVTTNPGAGNIAAFLNQRTGLPVSTALFNAAENFMAGTSPTGIAVGDFDGDGKLDVAVTNAVNSAAATISVFRNISTVGNIEFATRQAFAAAAEPADIIAADMDGDGKPDLVVLNQGTGANSFSVFRNKSTTGTIDASSFAAKVDYAVTTSPRSLAVADLDGDMRPEVIVTRITANMLAIYKNLMPLGPNITFTKQPSNSSACVNGTVTYRVTAIGATNLAYQWQVFNTTTSQFENVAANENYSGVNTATLVITNVTSSMNGRVYRCKVTGTDAVEKFSEQAVLTTASAPEAPTAAGATNCKGASLTLTASGGADGDYRWFDSSTAAQPISGAVNSSFATPVIFETKTFYVAVANSSGCVSDRSSAIATITPTAKPTISSNGTMLCGVNEVTISGPAGYVAYNWSNGDSGQNIDVSFAGSYSLIVEDANGCLSLASDPIVVTTGNVAKPAISASKTRLCAANDKLVLSGPAGLAGYEWSNGATTPTITVSAEGVYSLKVVNASGCRSESSDDFKVELGAEKPTISVGNDVLVSSPAKTYQWYYGDFAIPDGTKQFLKFNPFQYGVFSVAVTDLADCSAKSNDFVNLVTSVEHSEVNGIVYPNPFSEVLVVNVDADEARMFDTAGKEIKILMKGENDVAHLAKGVYLLRLRNGNEIQTIKVMK